MTMETEMMVETNMKAEPKTEMKMKTETEAEREARPVRALTGTTSRSRSGQRPDLESASSDQESSPKMK